MQSSTTRPRKAVRVPNAGRITSLKPSKYPTLESLAGVLPALNPPKTWLEIQDILADDLARAYFSKSK